METEQTYKVLIDSEANSKATIFYKTDHRDEMILTKLGLGCFGMFLLLLSLI